MLNILTIVLNGEPFIERHLPIFEKLKIPWRWFIAHGSANNGGSTAWCKPQEPGLSTDGTTEYLHSIKHHPNVRIIENPLWPSKDHQVNCAAAFMDEPGVLLQCDSDEIWTAPQLERIAALFSERPKLTSIMFACRYFCGPDIITVGEHCYGDNDFEWLRAFRFSPKDSFTRHEPPVLDSDNRERMSKEEARKEGLVFEHFAYATEAQAVFKEQFYGYVGLAEAWRKLQKHQHFPDRLQRFFAHVDERAMVTRI